MISKPRVRQQIAAVSRGKVRIKKTNIKETNNLEIKFVNDESHTSLGLNPSAS